MHTESLAVPPNPTLFLMAQRFMGLALQRDYLSTGRGHQQSHRVVANKRHQPAALQEQPLPPAAGLPGRSFTDAEQHYLSRVAAQPRLSSTEEYQLAKRMRAGDAEARNALIQANLGLVVMFARRHVRPGLPLLDLVAEGNLGLFGSADRFDPEMGFRFGTYAKLWILHGIRSTVRRFSEAQGLHGNRFEEFDKEEDGSTLCAPAVDSEWQGASTAKESDDGRSAAAWSSDGGTAAETDSEPHQVTLYNQRNALLKLALGKLSERDLAIVSARFALVEEEEQTLASLAQRFSLSIERVRQIEQAALHKLARSLGELGVTADGVL